MSLFYQPIAGNYIHHSGHRMPILGSLLCLAFLSALIQANNLYSQLQNDEGLITLFLGILCLIGGLNFLIGPRGITICSNRKSIKIWHRLIFPIALHEYDFSEFDRLQLKRTKYFGINHYQLILEGHQRIILEDAFSTQKIQKQAQQLANYMHLPLIDQR